MVSARGWASLRARGALSLASPPVPHGLTSQPLPSVLLCALVSPAGQGPAARTSSELGHQQRPLSQMRHVHGS